MRLTELLASYTPGFHPMFFKETSQLVHAIDLSPTNAELTTEVFESTDTFSDYINRKRQEYGAYFLIGGYGERREIYRRAELFDDNLVSSPELMDEPRNIHLGVDVWAPEGTKVFCPMAGMVHGFAFNDHFGDYGATIILQHQWQGRVFHTLYGHLSLQDLENLYPGKYIETGTPFCHFGAPAENGHWPPHVHFQIIEDLQGMVSDYPGVCKTSEKEFYLSNCPNANLMLKFANID